MNKLYFLLLLFTGMAFAAPPIGTPNNLQACDNGNDGVEVFDLTVNTSVVLGALNADSYSVAYFVSSVDANNYVNPIANPNAFSSSGQVIYVRLEENADTSNFAVASFNLQVVSLPFATISGSASICSGDMGVIFITGTPNAVVTYTVNNGAPQVIILNATGTATIAAQAVFTSVYQLVSVSVGSIPCTQPLIGSVVITVYSVPSAEIVTPDQTVCSNTSIDVTFQGSGGSAPYIFTYSINGGAMLTESSNQGNFATITLPGTPGIYDVDLISVQSLANNCSQNVSDSVHLVVSEVTTTTPQNLYVVDNPFDGFAEFDLTLNTGFLINGDPNRTITYHETLTDAEIDGNAIAAPSSYINLSNGQMIWARVESNFSGCFVIRSFRLFVTDPNAPNDFIFIPDANFKSALITIGVDTNNDGQIQYVEATAVTQLTFFSNLGIADLTGINFFTNLTSANFNNNQIAGILDISNLINLNSFECNYNQITGLLLPSSGALTQLFCGQNQITSLNVSGNTGLQTLYCTDNEISSLILTPSLTILSCDWNNLTTFDISNLTNLQHLQCSGNDNLTSFTANNLPNLTLLTCINNPSLLSMDIQGCTGLEFLVTTGDTALSSLNINGCTNLNYLDCANGQLTTLDASNLPLLQRIMCNNNLLTSLNISGCPVIKNLICNNNQLTTVDVSGTPELEIFTGNDNQFTALTVTNKPNLISFNCNANANLASLDLSGCSVLGALYLSELGQLATLNVSGCTAMIALQCELNVLTSLDVSGLTNLLTLYCQANQISTLNLTNCTSLQFLSCSSNNLTTLDVSDSPLIITLDCSDNDLTALDVSNLTSMTNLHCSTNALTTLDVTNSPNLAVLNCTVNNLVSLFVKNGANESVGFHTNPNLIYICADEAQINGFVDAVAQYGMNAQVNTYCSFTPGGHYNNINGNIAFDWNNNGCGPEDAHPFIRVNISNPTFASATFTNASGGYNFYTGEGDYVVSPEFENPTWFNVSPTDPVISFPNDDNNIASQNFCITANGAHPDLEVVISPLFPSRPGFDAIYKVVYKNKGNQVLFGNVSFSYNDDLMDFVSASVAASTSSFGNLTWNFTNLEPFETRNITVTLNINAPTDTPAVNIGDLLTFTGTINPMDNDETVNDNTFIFNETVIGSFDPNDITCLQGGIVSPVEIGNYLHYAIRFENTGTAEAENIVVKTEVDPTQFDINSLQLLNASHGVDARINGNIVEFIFQNIMLESGGHGNVLLKVKSKDTLQSGDMVSKQANIYFDYNFPVETNDAETIFQSLGHPDFEIDNSISIYPNPSNGIVNISGDFNIRSTQLYDVQGRLLQTNLVNESSTVIDLSAQSNGMYFIKVITDKGIKVEKIVRK
ncbi:DUF7619 domain-containing protein [Flavobacterium terrisoli]|uniref:DUF7619 domain-containing protein n=1 Tax=Flavobacterium terrisoli TaxID=3242195 RepID=UPI00254375B6|nr:T9SS type A sorting domain-containing protein [Flavobacterium buctense]